MDFLGHVLSQHWTGGHLVHDLPCRGQASLATSPPAGQRLGLARGRLAFQPIEHIQVLPLDYRPRGVTMERIAPLSPEDGADGSGGLETVETLGEFLERVVVEAAVRPQHLSAQDVACAVDQHGQLGR